MSEERLRELGMPRRAFLKRAAVVFAAPVIVSFGLDGIAEASPSSFPNMCFGNQALGDKLLADLAGLVATCQQDGGIQPAGIARSLLAKISAARKAFDAGDLATACGALADLQSEVSAQSGKHVDADCAARLAILTRDVQRELGCDRCL